MQEQQRDFLESQPVDFRLLSFYDIIIQATGKRKVSDWEQPVCTWLESFNLGQY
jgi:hypothetical protein